MRKACPPLAVVVEMDELAAEPVAAQISVEQTLHQNICTAFGRARDHPLVVCFDRSAPFAVNDGQVTNNSRPYHRTTGFMRTLERDLLTTAELGLYHDIDALKQAAAAQYLVLRPGVVLEGEAISTIERYFREYVRTNDYRHARPAAPSNHLKDVVYTLTPVSTHGATGLGVLSTWILFFTAVYVMYCKAWMAPFRWFCRCVEAPLHFPAADVTLYGVAPGDLRRPPQCHLGYMPSATRLLSPRQRTLEIVMERTQYRALTSWRLGNLLAYVTLQNPGGTAVLRSVGYLLSATILAPAAGLVQSVLPRLADWPLLAPLVAAVEGITVLNAVYVMSPLSLTFTALLYLAIAVKLQHIANHVLAPRELAAHGRMLIVLWPLGMLAFCTVYPLLWMASFFGVGAALLRSTHALPRAQVTTELLF